MLVTGSYRCPGTLVVLCLCCVGVHAQSVAFDLRSYQDCPIALVGYSPALFRSGGIRRQFVTVKNVSGRASAALVFQQTLRDGPRAEIAALERVSVTFRPRETKRLSVSVEDAWNRIQNAARSGAASVKPVLSIVVVEFIDGSTWSAPLDPVVR